MSFLRSLIVFAASASLASADAQATNQSATYLLQGVVRDSASGSPLQSVFVWPAWQRNGAITDSLGRYSFRWRAGAPHLLYVGRCEFTLEQRQPPWLADSVLTYEILLPTRYQQSCPNSPRAPWVVDATDTTTLVGIYTYSWEGGGWITRCDGKTFRPDWQSPWREALAGKIEREGHRLFVRIRGRLANDGYGGSFPGSLFLTYQVEEVRPERPNDCR
jgi:hypothetical protein